jgi:hypothetical protein
MISKGITVAMILLLVGASTLRGQQASDADARSRWSLGTSLTYPLAGIYQLQINYMASDRHEFVIGPAYQNFRSGSVTSHAYTVILAYRYYLWRGLHVESEWWPAYNSMHSSITDSRYPGVEMWTELKVGYKLHVSRHLYIKPAPGVGVGILRTNRPPGFEEDIRSPVFAPQLILGVQL